MELWHYLVNQFLTSTVDNFKKALKLSNYHHAYLNGKQTSDPGDLDWAMLYDRYDLFHQNFVNTYSAWKNAGGEQKGQTVNMDQMLKILITRINQWDMQIQIIPGFEKGTGNHSSIFPQGRRPFNSGGKDDRVAAVMALGLKLASYPTLSAIAGMVNSFHTQLLAASNVQTVAKADTKAASLTLELMRVEVMTEQFRNLGFLINKEAEMPVMIQPFFDLNVLRESNQVVFTGTLDPNETEAVLIHTFLADDELQLEIKGDPALPAGTMVQFYLATIPSGTDSMAVEVEANVLHTTITAANFGITTYGTHRHLTAVNSNGVELHYVVELM